MAAAINDYVIKLDNMYLLLAASLPCFAVTCLISWFTYEKFEKRFLKKRRPYLVDQQLRSPAPDPLVATAP
jgi:peptidoglycan/LPS O-acetylase OafA/YrhL